jgi:hypothetical protein
MRSEFCKLPVSGYARTWTAIGIFALTMAAVLVHGYHVGVEDQEVYLSAIRKELNPNLYPYNSEFFMTQMQGTVFTRLLAFCVYKSNVSIETVLFAFHLLSVFLILLGCWMIGRRCFSSKVAVWSGLLLVTALLTIPVAGTALYIVDQYLHPRAMATWAILFAIAAVLDNRVVVCVVWLLIATLIHPLMAVFGISYVMFLAWRKPTLVASRPAGIVPLSSISFGWRRAAQARSYYFVMQWAWYEWLGVALPIALVWWFIRLARIHGLLRVAFMYQRLFYFGLFQLAFALALTAPPPLLTLSALQPMRWMQLFYLLFFLLTGGLIGEFLLRDHAWRWVMLFVPLFAGMFYTQRQLFPSSSHIELSCGKNDWCQAFDWVRENTPKDAYFALNPRYVNISGEDHHGFRSWAERSMLEEESQDAGAATLFPGLLDRWYEQSRALEGWEQFELPQFIRLHDRFGVNWALLERDVSGLPCPYRNRSVRVCRIP